MSEWKFFVLGRDRTPLPNCSRCAMQSRQNHDPESCACLSCHGFYAATADPIALAEMSRLHPTNAWALRTGRMSGVVVIDAEGPGKEDEGLSTLDKWEEFTGWSLPPTLTAGTPSGGRHLYYAFPELPSIPSRNRVLPGVDVKADGGYVVVPHVNTPARKWLTEQTPQPLHEDAVRWLAQIRTRPGGGNGPNPNGQGYDFKRFVRDGCPGGVRDDFFNDLIFRARRQGRTAQQAYDEAYFHWTRCAQPPDAAYLMPWEHVEYKLRRVWATVEPAVSLDPDVLSWAAAQLSSRQQDVRRVGRATIIRNDA